MTHPGETRPGPRVWSPAWWLLLWASALVVTVADIALLREGTGFLTTGYNSVSIGSLTEILAFVAASLTLDLTLILLIWSFLVPILSRLPLSSLQTWCVGGVVALGAPLAFSAARYNLYSVAGNMFNVTLMSQLDGTITSSVVIEMIDESQLLWAITTPVLAVVLFGAILWLGRLQKSLDVSDSRFAPPSSARIWRLLLPGFAVAVVILMAASPKLAQLRYGLGKKASGAAIMDIARWVTDVDRDGFDAFTEPRDTAAWDSRIHPYALDVPGNGIDEDGIGGDFVARRSPAAEIPTVEPTTGSRPHVLLIYLESFRADLIHSQLDGQPVTPFLDRLAADGVMSSHAYVHSPWTLAARSQLFGGRLVNHPGQSTLIDDFKDQGYTVAYFSGQDESYGGSEEILGVERADVFYDARMDADKRTSRSTASVSLQVSWKTLLRRVTDHLDELDVDRPLFLYVNIVDTHFPYHHAEIDDMLGVPPLRRDEIRVDNAERVLHAYENTAANVDEAVRRLVEAWRARIGDADHAIVVLSDHGQAFYEEGTLGHGHSVSPAECRVPLIVWGIGGEWPEPIAPTDIRGLLRRNLGVDRGGAPPRPRFVPDRKRSILQYVSKADRPLVIALRRYDDLWSYDFSRDRFERTDADGSRTALDRVEHQAMFQELVWRWEALKLARAQPRPKPAPSAAKPRRADGA